MAPFESTGMSDGRRVGEPPCCVAVAAEEVEAEGKAEEAAGKAAGAATQREKSNEQQPDTVRVSTKPAIFASIVALSSLCLALCAVV